MYLLRAIMFFFLVGGIFALIIRIRSTRSGVGQTGYNQLFTLHGAVMIFVVFSYPVNTRIIGQLRCSSCSAPRMWLSSRLNLASWYIYVVGALFLMYSIFTGAAAPLRRLTPYSTQTTTSV